MWRRWSNRVSTRLPSPHLVKVLGIGQKAAVFPTVSMFNWKSPISRTCRLCWRVFKGVMYAPAKHIKTNEHQVQDLAKLMFFFLKCYVCHVGGCNVFFIFHVYSWFPVPIATVKEAPTSVGHELVWHPLLWLQLRVGTWWVGGLCMFAIYIYMNMNMHIFIYIYIYICITCNYINRG